MNDDLSLPDDILDHAARIGGTLRKKLGLLDEYTPEAAGEEGQNALFDVLRNGWDPDGSASLATAIWHRTRGRMLDRVGQDRAEVQAFAPQDADDERTLDDALADFGHSTPAADQTTEEAFWESMSSERIPPPLWPLFDLIAEHLNQREWVAYEMVGLEGLSASSAATELGVSRQAVDKLVTRATEKLTAASGGRVEVPRRR